MSLKPEVLDIIITKITKHTVFYKLTNTGQEETWEIPSNSTFDLKHLRLGTRYKVLSNVIMTRVAKVRKSGSRYYGTGKFEYKERYDWVSAEPLPTYIKCQARTAKQSAAIHDMMRLELVDDGTLFQWGGNTP